VILFIIIQFKQIPFEREKSTVESKS